MSIYSFKTIGTTASNYPHRFNFFSLSLRFSVLDLIKSGTNRKLFISAQFASDDCTIIVCLFIARSYKEDFNSCTAVALQSTQRSDRIETQQPRQGLARTDAALLCSKGSAVAVVYPSIRRILAALWPATAALHIAHSEYRASSTTRVVQHRKSRNLTMCTVRYARNNSSALVDSTVQFTVTSTRLSLA
jgi:hypothetical protein